MNWPEDYYRQLDGDKRLELLEEYEAEQAAPDPENAARRQIWDARYSKGGTFDGFIKAWLDLAVISRSKGFLGVARDKKKAETAARKLLLDRYHEDELTRRMLDAEYEHLFRMIIHLESTDYSFNHHVLGLTKLSNEGLQKKITNQFTRVLRTLPGKHQLTELFAPLEAAGFAVLEDSFEPESKEQ